MQATQLVYSGFAIAFGLCLSLFFAWLFICSWHALLGLPSRPRPDQARPGLRCSYCLHASNLSLAINLGPHTRDSDSSRAGRIPNWQLATGNWLPCHDHYQLLQLQLQPQPQLQLQVINSRNMPRLPTGSRMRIVGPCCILTLMRRALEAQRLAQLMTHPYQQCLLHVPLLRTSLKCHN